MNKFLLALSIFAVSAFLALVVGVSQAQAGNGPSVAPDPADCDELCDGVSDSCDGATTPCLCDTDPCEGTEGDDVICGSGSGEEIRASFGDDIVCGRGGNDTLLGGFGCDDLQGEGGMDTLQGGHCADSLDGGAAAEGDTCKGGFGADSFTGCDLSMSEGQPGDHRSQGECVSAGCGND
jgi:Ca2+-binding RTX toxin-like protein